MPHEKSFQTSEKVFVMLMLVCAGWIHSAWRWRRRRSCWQRRRVL